MRGRTGPRPGEQEDMMAILFAAFVFLGLFGVLCNIASALGEIICALLKYVVLPFGILFLLCGILKYGL